MSGVFPQMLSIFSFWNIIFYQIWSWLIPSDWVASELHGSTRLCSPQSLGYRYVALLMFFSVGTRDLNWGSHGYVVKHFTNWTSPLAPRKQCLLPGGGYTLGGCPWVCFSASWVSGMWPATPIAKGWAVLMPSCYENSLKPWVKIHLCSLRGKY